ncbi:hypothetical protein [Chryseobacterium sp. ISL-6]|uniref:hypothetical protein n=1 Tax=Chryseobacterium sp. ISL-6 TaxID=2819143 RepID=UPI001BECC10B|nr:hypothetical protein [Chryseobacterium sp. ISL-6]MBT2621920.1 hypothetical protein [Chryseobacterium sp. ISL-6]
MSRTTSAESTTIRLTTFLRENLTLLLIVPTLLGGFEQFAILCFKSFTLLLYYSPTQVPVDGISILVKVPIFLVAVFTKVQFDEARNNIKAKWGTLVFFSTFIIMVIALICLLFVKEEYKLLGRVCYLTIANILVLWGLLKQKRFLQTFNKKASFVTALSIVFSMFFNIFTKPDYSEISNINKLTVKIRITYPKAKLLYCNDKYLFFERDSTQFSNIDRYEIVPLEHLFLEHYDPKTTQ